MLYLPFIADKPSPAIQTSESSDSAEHVLLLLKNIVDVSLKKLDDRWSNQSEEKDRKEDRRCRCPAFSRDVICMETGRG